MYKEDLTYEIERINGFINIYGKYEGFLFHLEEEFSDEQIKDIVRVFIKTYNLGLFNGKMSKVNEIKKVLNV